MFQSELLALLEQIETHYKNKYLRDNGKRNIKYVTFRLDTRDMKIYYLSFREWFNPNETTFTLNCANDVIKMYEWLNKEENK